MRLTAVMVAASVAIPLPALASVQWTGDFETGNISQWTSAEAFSSDRLQVVQSPSPVRQGQYALQATVKQGDIVNGGTRAELDYEGHDPEGSERYFRWSTYFPNDFAYSDLGQTVIQWHHYGTDGSPPLEMGLSSDVLKFVSTTQAGVDTYLWTAPLVRGVWHDWILHVLWSSDPTVGFVELWYDGKQVVQKTNTATMFPGMENYLKIGLYRNGGITQDQTLYDDDVVEGTEWADVAPGAPAPDAGSPSPVLDAGSPAPVVDAGSPSPVVDAGSPAPTPDAGSPPPPTAGVGDLTYHTTFPWGALHLMQQPSSHGTAPTPGEWPPPPEPPHAGCGAAPELIGPFGPPLLALLAWARRRRRSR